MLTSKAGEEVAEDEGIKLSEAVFETVGSVPEASKVAVKLV